MRGACRGRQRVFGAKASLARSADSHLAASPDSRELAFESRLRKESGVLLASARDELLAYWPANDSERGYRARMLQLLDMPKSLSRQHFEPGHFTASAFVLTPERDALLLILHKKLGLWLQPGGHLEPDDASLGAAAWREAREEVMVELEPATGAIFDVDIHAIPARREDPEHLHFDVRYCFTAQNTEIRASDEVAGARWVRLTELEGITRDASVLRAARKLTAARPVFGGR
jgi:8-oxo-dGTP pyrophosphatase MutT (NUDIX family)